MPPHLRQPLHRLRPTVLSYLIVNCATPYHRYHHHHRHHPSISVNIDVMLFYGFPACTLAYCGEGTCIKTSGLEHKCECANGFANLFNRTNFPCFSECMKVHTWLSIIYLWNLHHLMGKLALTLEFWCLDYRCSWSRLHEPGLRIGESIIFCIT